jgi:hypothetical protein
VVEEEEEEGNKKCDACRLGLKKKSGRGLGGAQEQKRSA